MAKVLNLIYKKLFGPRFLRSIIRAFRPQNRRADDFTEADVELVFNKSSTEPLPSPDEVVKGLKDVAENNNTFEVEFDATAISVINEPHKVPVQFRTNGTFEASLSDSSSDLFTNRALMIKTGLSPFFVADFPTAFTILTISNFSNGVLKEQTDSIMTFINLYFAHSAELPNNTQIGKTILRAANDTSLPFKIFLNDIIVNGTPVISSSDVSSKINMFMACFMVAVSLLFTWSS
ncbi:uncharacterized protein LOC132883442 isoform X3 [Neoarius graeffei]|nr:uncharacterized protein LOC132883442 isoform X3 [Neoarius graeffei]